MKNLIFFSLVLGGVLRADAGLVFGGFDSSRGGATSLESGLLLTDFRTHITGTFEGSSFTSSGSLTASYLSAVDVLVLGVAVDGMTAISPLTMSEQSELLVFVQGGGALLVFADNNIQFETVSDSILGPFGLDSTGAIFGSGTSTIVDASHPVASGPFGSVTSFSHSSFPGWFSSLGANAVEVGRLDQSSSPSLAAIPRGAFGGQWWGGVLQRLFADQW
ncbi:MAG: hypothetical protein HC841_04450 [Verrucomicrobiae bacterium]|nr:hypothetical protein [Verrucomicrobiae bacterium]